MTKTQKIVTAVCAAVLVLLWAGIILRTANEKGWIGEGTPYVPEVGYDPSYGVNPDDFQNDLSGTDAPSQTDALPPVVTPPVVTPTDTTTAVPAPAVSSTDAAVQQSAATTTAPAQTIPDVRLVRIADYIPEAVIELKYATPENFTGSKQYSFTEAYLRYGTVKKLLKVNDELAAKGYKLKIWDAYRPYETQCKLWESFPNPDYVSDPATGYLGHCRGNAVDVTIVNADGSYVEMPTGFDEFSAAADRDYSDVDAKKGENARMLEQIMTDCGFVGEQSEWWHFADSVEYEIEKRFVPAK